MKESVPFGVIFDMDGVLIDSADAHFRSWQLLAEEEGGWVDRNQFDATFGRHNRDIVPLLLGVVDEQEISVLADRKEAIYRDLVRQRLPIVAGAVALVRALREAGVPPAVGSSAPRANIDLVLEAMGITDAVTVVISAEDVTRGKPDPHVFSLAAEGLCLPASRCVVVEDAPAGVQSARSAGAHVVAILSTHTVEAFGPIGSETGPDIFVETLADLSVEKMAALVHQ